MRPGRVFLNNRYHDPTLGQFISVDPLVTTTGQPYIYGNANPVTYSDPTGLDPDTSSTIQYKSFEYCVGGDARCAGESIRRLFSRFRNTSTARSIHATLDVTYQQDWSKLDGYVSDKDLEYGAQPGGVGVLYLLNGDQEASAAVARVAEAFVGSSEWEALAGARRTSIGALLSHLSLSFGGCVVACADFTVDADGLHANLGGAFGLAASGPSVGWSQTMPTSEDWPWTADVSDPDNHKVLCGAFVVGGCITHSVGDGTGLSVTRGFGFSTGWGVGRSTVDLPWFW